MLWGHALLQQKEILHLERYAASGSITTNNKVIEASGVPGEFDTGEEAELAGIQWARAWMDSVDWIEDVARLHDPPLSFHALLMTMNMVLSTKGSRSGPA